MIDWQEQWAYFVRQWTNNGYKMFLRGLSNTCKIAILGLIIGIILGAVIAIIRVMPKYKLIPRILDKISAVYVAFFRGTPILVQLIIVHYILKPIFGFSVSSIIEAIIVFGLNSGAYVSEIMRSGINSVDKGQMEAGRSLGLGYWTTMVKIVLPQAIKNIIPTLGNEFIALMKDTSVVNIIAVDDLYRAFNLMGGSKYWYIIPYLVLAICYIVLVLIIAGLVKIIEKVMSKSDKKQEKNSKSKGFGKVSQKG
ncbi:MAG: amino acid ABC transporter permease [Clostridia bacterium]|nr:amino acid ABC transporter permease [Clostridia bacterium]